VRGKPASPVLRGGWRSNAPPLPDRGVRPLKTQQKVSGRLTSDDVTQDRLDIRSYIATARKHGLGALQALEQLMLAIPWTPPAQPGPHKSNQQSTPPSHPVTRVNAYCSRSARKTPEGWRNVKAGLASASS
jgi:hypothetical protein